MQDKPNSAKDIENITFDILKGSKAFGCFPTPIDQIVKFAELRIVRSDGLIEIPKNYIARSSEILKSALRKALGALDRREKKIYLDFTQPKPRIKFATLHETGHEVLPWQQKLYQYLEDDECSLDDQATKEEFEVEASYFASAALFQLNRFDEELRTLPLEIGSAMALAKQFGSSQHAAIRRYVECSNKRCALLVLKDFDGVKMSAKKRNYFQSASFSKSFGSLEWPDFFEAEFPFISDMAYKRKFYKDGSLAYGCSVNGQIRFNYHFFNNTYNTFILLMPVGEHNKSRTTIHLK